MRGGGRLRPEVWGPRAWRAGCRRPSDAGGGHSLLALFAEFPPWPSPPTGVLSAWFSTSLVHASCSSLAENLLCCPHCPESIHRICPGFPLSQAASWAVTDSNQMESSLWGLSWGILQLNVT